MGFEPYTVVLDSRTRVPYGVVTTHRLASRAHASGTHRNFLTRGSHQHTPDCSLYASTVWPPRLHMMSPSSLTYSLPPARSHRIHPRGTRDAAAYVLRDTGTNVMMTPAQIFSRHGGMKKCNSVKASSCAPSRAARAARAAPRARVASNKEPKTSPAVAVKLLAKLASRTGRFLSKGMYGKTYEVPVTSFVARLVRSLDNRISPVGHQKAVVIKVQSNNWFAKNEVAMHAKLANPRTCGTFDGQARCTASIVPKLFGTGDDGETTVIVMEVLRGRTMGDTWKAQGNRLTPRQYRLYRYAARTLWAAGFTHNDFHGQNVWLTPEGTVKVLDFGQTLPLPSKLTSTADEDKFAEMVKRVNDAFAYKERFATLHDTGNVESLKVARWLRNRWLGEAR